MLIFLLYLFTFGIIWHFAGYPLVMGLVSLVVDEPARHEETTPFITIIVPSYNERGAIERRVKNLDNLEYPHEQYEILFVDSASTDGTAELTEYLIESRGQMTLIRESERRGKASAINVGMAQAAGEIVLVTDANTIFRPDVLQYIAHPFSDPKVGAVAGQLSLPETDSGITASNQFYRYLEHIKALGETRLDSVCQFDGEISAWRKELAEAEPSSLSEDLDLSIRIRRQGYKIAYAPEAVVYEAEPDTASEQISSNKRRSIGTIQAFFEHSRYLMVPGDVYRALIFPSRKILPMLSPFLLIGVFLSLIALKDLRLVLQYLTISSICAIVVFVGLLEMKSRLVNADEKSGMTFSIRTGFDIAYYILLIEYILLKSWVDYISGNYSVLWQKSSTDR